jgi:hypothetical protein
VRVIDGERGLSLESTGVKGDVDEKGPVVDVVVVTGDSVSELVSFGRLSLRRRLSTRALLDRLWGGLSAMLAAPMTAVELRETPTKKREMRKKDRIATSHVLWLICGTMAKGSVLVRSLRLRYELSRPRHRIECGHSAV